MDVEALDLEAELARPLDLAFGGVGREPELRLRVRRLDRAMRDGLDARRQAHEHAGTPAAAAASASPGASSTTSAPASAAARNSSSDLLLPWKTSRSPGTPAACANASSPSVETSAPTPSSASSRSSATFANAFVP